jgi:acyl transferase domain-containing protein
LWRSLGVTPHAVVGHSQGEIAAAHVAGALSLADATAVVALRSRAIATTLAGNGGMVSIPLSHVDTSVLLQRWDGRLHVATMNSPSFTVVSGDAAAIAELHETCTAEGIRSRVIQVDYASHSPHVAQIRDDLRCLLADIKPMKAAVRFYSTLEQRFVEDTTTLDADYWYRNLRQPVRFHEAIESLAKQYTTFVETSAHPVLTPAMQETLSAQAKPVNVAGTLRRQQDTPTQVLTAAAALYTRGTTVAWPVAGRPAHDLIPPTYPFQHKNYWLASSATPVASGSIPLTDDDTDGTMPLREQLAGLDEPAQRATITELVCAEAASTLGRPGTEFGSADIFFEVGFTSLAAVELRNRLGEATELKLPVTLLFDYGTPQLLAEHLREQLCVARSA